MVHDAKMTVTLYWEHQGREEHSDISCEDSLPRDLIRVLVRQCGLPVKDSAGDEITYELRAGSKGAMPLDPSQRLSLQGVRTGSKLWLVPVPRRRAGPPRCILTLPDGTELVVPSGGLVITRRLLLVLLELLSPERYTDEIRRLERRESPYRFVSNRDHCEIRLNQRGHWSIVTKLDDVETLHNGEQMVPNALETLYDGDVVHLGGRAGVRLRVTIL